MKKLLFSIFLLWAGCLIALPGPEDDTKLTKTIDRSFVLPKNGHVDIVNKYGQIVITPWDKDSVVVKVKITAYGKDYDDADKLMDRVDIDFRSTGPYLTIETLLDRRSGFFKELWNDISDYSKTLLSKNKLEIDYEVSIPKHISLDLENKFGDVYLRELYAKCDINVMHGNLRANNFNASARINVSYGDVKIKNLKQGRLTLKAAEGDIMNLGDVMLKSSSSELEIGEAEDLNLDSRSDKKLEIGSVSKLSGKALFSKIDIEVLEKSTDLTMNYGELNVENVPFSFSKINIDSKYTDISLNFDQKAYLEVDISAKEESLRLPRENVSIDRDYVDGKEKYVRISGTMGNKNNYPGYVYINSSGGEVVISLSSLEQSVNK